MFAKIWEWATNLFTPKGYGHMMPTMHLKAIPKHDDLYIVEIEQNGDDEESFYREVLPMNNIRVNPNPTEPCICFSEALLHPGCSVWLNEDALTLWTSYFTKFRIQIRHKATGEVYMGWQLMDQERRH